MTTHSRLIEGLKHTLEAGGTPVTIREPHISWVLLAGEEAWKIKKEVDFGFLDFSTLEKRRFACEEELRLNRRFAPDIYLDVSRICGPPDQPRIDAQSEPLEYAVHMRRFNESGLLSSLARKRQLGSVHIDAVASCVARMHQQIPVAEHSSHWGEPQQVHSWLLESYEHIRRLVDPAELERVRISEQQAEELYTALQSSFRARNDSGFVRECHGDLHLRNMIWTGDDVIPFDCIEFNPGLRWIDVMSEAAFVMMDLQERGYTKLAWRFINRYISTTGDYEGMKVLRY